MSEKTIIEVNGVKLEVDLRTARRVDELRIGDAVKVLIKTYGGHEVHPGVVVGFEPFVKLPTIIIAYAKTNWQDAKIEFVHFNAKSDEIEVVKSLDDDLIDKEAAVRAFDREIVKLERQIADLVERKAYFLSKFGIYWEKVVVEPAKEII